jgi:hypothetical protein
MNAEDKRVEDALMVDIRIKDEGEALCQKISKMTMML